MKNGVKKANRQLRIVSRVLYSFVSSRRFLYLVLGWFTLQAIYTALTTRFFIPPDEQFHFQFIEFYATGSNTPFPSSQEGYYNLGEIVQTPFFIFHYVLGQFVKITGLDITANSTFYLLRLINIGISLLSLVTIIRIAKFLKLSTFTTNIGLFMITNTLMFVFLSGAISYDNLFILAGLTTILYSLYLSEKLTLRSLLKFVLALAIGSMTKITFLPVGFLAVLYVLVSYFHAGKKNVRKLSSKFSKTIQFTLKNTALFVLCVLSVSLLLLKYIPNLANYSSLEPKCDRVLTLEQCRESALFVRNERIYKTDPRVAETPPYEYIFNWSTLIQERTFGVFGHKVITPLPMIAFGIFLLAVWWIIIGIRHYSRSKPEHILLYFSLGYALFVLVQNYLIYQASGRITFAVHGRYLFVSLPLLYLLGNYYINKVYKNKTSIGLYILFILILFSISSLPTYLYSTDSEWRTPRANQIGSRVFDS